MTFVDLPSGAAVFLDANTFVYHASLHPQLAPPCTALLERIERGDLRGYTSTHVVSEVAHRLMTLEACALFGWPYAGIAVRLRRHPAEFARLSAYKRTVDAILQSKIQILTIAPTLIANAATISPQFALLTNDALIVALMQANGLVNLASHDADFSRIPTLNRFAPV